VADVGNGREGEAEGVARGAGACGGDELVQDGDVHGALDRVDRVNADAGVTAVAEAVDGEGSVASVVAKGRLDVSVAPTRS